MSCVLVNCLIWKSLPLDNQSETESTDFLHIIIHIITTGGIWWQQAASVTAQRRFEMILGVGVNAPIIIIIVIIIVIIVVETDSDLSLALSLGGTLTSCFILGGAESTHQPSVPHAADSDS